MLTFLYLVLETSAPGAVISLLTGPALAVATSDGITHSPQSNSYGIETPIPCTLPEPIGLRNQPQSNMLLPSDLGAQICDGPGPVMVDAKR